MRASLAWLHEAAERNDAMRYQRDSGAPASIWGMYPFSIGGASKSQSSNVAGMSHLRPLQAAFNPPLCLPKLQTLKIGMV
jgi:hypothetical protein